ncbi:MAG: carboxyl transferase domain-containing protein [Pseudomonadota bacterium]
MTFEPQITKAHPDYAQNRMGMLQLVDKMRGLEARATAASEKRRPVFDKRGQLSPRERLAALLDPGMPWLELFNLASYMVDDPNPDTSVPGGSMITGIGYVSGARCFIFIDDSGINAGAMTEKSVEKALAAVAVAQRQKLPFIHLVESAGANLMAYTVELWAHGGGMFAGLAKLSASGIPVITVLHGASTAGGAYQPGLSDYVVGVKDNGMAMLAGAALVKAATGEEARDTELGGAEMHATTTGLVDYLAENDAHGIAIAREIVGRLNWDHAGGRSRAYDHPRHDTDHLAGVVPLDHTQPYDAREVVARIADNSDFTEFKPGYGPATVCLHTRLMGHDVQILANNGPIDPDGATKATHFLQLAQHTGTPVIFLNNTTGYMVGAASEHAGMIKHGSKMIQAVTNITVPKLSLYIGASFGAGNYGMCGYAYGADFLFTWPNAKTGVMGGAQAAGTMEAVARAGAARKGAPVDEDRLAKQSAQITTHFDRQSDAFYTSGRMLDMGMIDPRDTRRVLGFCLDTCAEGRRRELSPNTFGIARP